jgi:hypothetical protein
MENQTSSQSTSVGLLPDGCQFGDPSLFPSTPQLPSAMILPKAAVPLQPHQVLSNVLQQLEHLQPAEIARILRAAATFFDVTEEMEM